VKITGLVCLPILLLGFAAQAAPTHDWTSLYGGIELGAMTFNPDWQTTQTFNPIGGYFPAESSTNPSMKTTGLLTSLFIGKNWSVAPKWLLGAEARLGLTDKTSTVGDIPGLDPEPSQTGPATFQSSRVSVQTKWNGSIRARAGYLAAPATLVYGTLGLAFQKLKMHGQSDGDGFVSNPELGILTGGATKTVSGWVLGAGLEQAFSARWTGRIEYAYTKYQSVSFTHLQWLQDESFGATAKLDPRATTLTAGLSYKF
jgi:outer membrane immunogenic protein